MDEKTQSKMLVVYLVLGFAILVSAFSGLTMGLMIAFPLK